MHAPGRAARRRDVSRLQRQGPRDPVGLAGPQGQQQAPGLEVGPADRVDDAQAAAADQQTSIRVRSAAATWLVSRAAEAEPAQAEPDPAQEQRTQGPPGVLGQRHADGPEDGVRRRRAPRRCGR